MNLVDEENDLALGALDLFYRALEPLFKLAAEACSGYHGPHVELYHLLAAEDLGDIVLRQLASQALCDGRLAHPGPADEDRVILGPAAEYLDHAQNLGIPANDRVELALVGQLGQVAAEFLQRTVAGLCLRAGDLLPAAHLFDDLQDALAVHARLGQDPGRGGIPLVGNGQEKVLGGDIVVLQFRRFLVRLVDHSLESRRDVHLAHAPAIDLGARCAP